MSPAGGDSVDGPDPGRETGATDMEELMSHDITKRLVWSGLLAAFGALASVLATRAAGLAFRRLYGEDPPE